MSNIDDFMRRFGDYLAKANESKKRGNNDYNPLKAVQKPYDEVNMHSGFIYSLLDTNGEHYQDDLFLSLFLEVLGIKEWFGSTTNAQVRKEFQYIDLYIFNDTRHIIIENKIGDEKKSRDDQPNQIANYIEKVHSNGVEYENIFVVFLTLHDREPSQNSRTNKDNNLLWEVKGDEFLVSKEGEKINRVGYKKVLYENEILEWIDKSQSKNGVGNITNLNYALESYKNIVQIVTGKKESTMGIADFFKDSKDFEIAFEIINNSDKIKECYIEYELQNLQKEKMFYDNWTMLSVDEFTNKFGDYIVCGNYKISKIIYNKIIEEQPCKLAFCIETEQNKNRKIVIGFLAKRSKEIEELQTRIELFRKIKAKKLKPTRDYWIWHYNEESNLSNLKVVNFFKKYADLVNQINEQLKQ